MTKAQLNLYRREWSAARKAGRLVEADRHRLHVEALGQDKSSLLLSNSEFDQMLAAFRAISQPTNLNAQLAQLDQPRTRLLHRIRDQFACLALFVQHPCNYVAAILRDRFHVEQLEELRADAYTRPRAQASEAGPKGAPITDSDLEQIRNTLARCLSALRRKGRLIGHATPVTLTEHDMCRLARVPHFRCCNQCLSEQRSPVAQVSQPAAVLTNTHTEEEPF